MKKAGLVIFVISGALSLFAQTKEDKARLRFQNQVGINATGFIKSFVSFSNTNPVPTANVPIFMVNYKGLFYNYFLSPGFKYGLRLGGNLANNETDNSTETTFNNTRSGNNAWRAGLELQQQITTRWILYYGADFFRSNAVSETNTKTNVGGSVSNPLFLSARTAQSNIASGVGPVLGIQFNINRNICLSTETSLYFISGSSSTETVQTLSDGSPLQQQPPSTGSIRQQTIALPAFINFSLMF